MSLSWTKKLISGITALSVAAALVVSVFSQSHAALNSETQTDVADPCAEHIATPTGPLAADNCETLCYSADLNHLLGAAIERSQPLELFVAPLSYDSFLPAPVHNRNAPRINVSRGPPGSDLYLITQRFRL